MGGRDDHAVMDHTADLTSRIAPAIPDSMRFSVAGNRKNDSLPWLPHDHEFPAVNQVIPLEEVKI